MWVTLRVALVFVALLGAARPVRAWTTAHVREAHVRAALRGDGRLHVRTEVALDVESGWVESLDFPGFEDVLELDAGEPARLVSDDGRELTPAVKLRQGVVTVTFPRRSSPRKGMHRLSWSYVTRAARLASGAGNLVRVPFTMPGWESGLRDASITFFAPVGSRPFSDTQIAQSVDIRTRDGGAQLTFRRVHLPRATPWTVAIDVRQEGWGRPDIAPEANGPSGKARPSPRPWRTGVWLAACVFVVGLGARARNQRTPDRTGRPSKITGHVPLGVAVLAAASGAMWWREWLPGALLSWLGVSLALALLPTACSAAPRKLAGVVPVPGEKLRQAGRARWLSRRGVWPWLDVHSMIGGLGLVAVLTVPCFFDGALDQSMDPWGLGLWCAVPALVAFFRRRLSLTVAEQLAELLRAAESMATGALGMRLVWCAPEGEAPSHPRLRLVPAAHFAGLLRIEVLAPGTVGGDFVAHIVVEEGALVLDWVDELFPAAERLRSPGGQRVAWRIRTPDVDAFASHVLAGLFQRSQGLVQVLSARSLRERALRAPPGRRAA